MLFIKGHGGIRPCIVQYKLRTMASGAVYDITSIVAIIKGNAVPQDVQWMRKNNHTLDDKTLMMRIQCVSEFVEANKKPKKPKTANLPI